MKTTTTTTKKRELGQGTDAERLVCAGLTQILPRQGFHHSAVVIPFMDLFFYKHMEIREQYLRV